jgi:23S rRNA (pseudouridine1915-N3)-methyltransferase
MKFLVVCIGKIKENFILNGVNEYARRIRRYTELGFLTIKEEKLIKGSQDSLVLQKEGKRVLHTIPQDSPLVALDRQGKGLNSLQHFDFINTQARQGVKKLIYLIGGPLGLSQEVLDHSDHLLSLSPMTLTHELTTLFLLEQIYRYQNFMAGEKYHK